MMTRGDRFAVTLAGAVLAGACAAEAPRNEATGEDAPLIASAMSAAPEFIARGATILVRTETGQPRTIREGTNGWTCFPDNPKTPGNMPMCADRAGMAWMQATMMKREPPEGPVSVAYMLQGSAFPSLDDPTVKEPAAGAKWMVTGPILMIMNVRGRLAGIPAESPNLNEPFVMWKDTPYEHLMVPVGTQTLH